MAFDAGGPITIAFAAPSQAFSAYFTYLTPLPLLAFDAANAQVASASSLFSNNLGTVGDIGSSPNELLQVSSPGGISSVLITGDFGGGCLVLDDVTISDVPEPRAVWLELAVIDFAALLLRQRLLSR